VSVSVSESHTESALDPLSVRRAWRLNILAGVGGTIFFAGATGVVLNGYALALGATDFHIGLMGAIPLVSLAAQVIGAYAVEGLRQRKTYWLWLCGLHRLTWVPILLIPYLLRGTSQNVQLTVFLLLMLVSGLLGSAATPAWFSWMADVVPDRQAGRFWGRRAASLQIVSLLVSVPIALYLDLFQKDRYLGYTMILAISVLAGVIDVLIHRWIPDPAMPQTPTLTANPVTLFLQPLRNKEFRRFLFLTCAWNFSVNLFAPFVHVYLLRDLKMAFLHVTLLSICFSLSVSTFSRFWGYIIDHFGKRPVIVVVMVVKFLIPGAYLFTHPGFIYPVLVPTFIIDGFLVAGLNLAIQAALLSYSPRESRSVFVAMYNAMIGSVAASAPILAGVAMAGLADFSFHWGPFHWTAIHLAFLSSTVLRLFVWPLGLFLVESGSGSPVRVVRTFLETNPFRVIHHLYVLSESSNLGQRVRSARALRRNPGPMAVERLVEALDDPNREVRAAAALALGQVNCPESIQALVHALRSPEMDIQPEAARALGALRTPQCIEALVDLLTHSEDTTLRNQVARILGQTHAAEAVTPLLSLFRDSHASNILASAAEALSQLGEIKALRAILPQLRQIDEPAVRAQMAVAVANLLGEEGEFYSILAEEKRTPGLAVARLQNAAAEDLRGLKMAAASADPAPHLAEMNLCFLRADYSGACREARRLCEHLFGLRSHEEGTEDEQAFVDRMRLFVLAQPKLGIQMWFLLVMGSEEWAAQGPVGLEIGLLAQYALVKVMDTLRLQPELMELGNGR